VSTPRQAADEIVHLINSNPSSPLPEQIEAIIARVVPPPSERSVLATEDIGLHAWWTDPSLEENEAELGRRLEKISAARQRIIEQGNDIQALAAMVLSCEGEPLCFENLPSASNVGGADRWAARALATAVLRQQPSRLGEVSPALVAAFAEWQDARKLDHAASGAYGRTNDNDDCIRADHCAEVHTMKSKALLALGAKSFSDLRLLLPVVMEWNSPMSRSSPDFPHSILEKGGGDEGESLAEISVAYFIRAVMGLLGIEDIGQQPVAVREGRGGSDDQARAATLHHLHDARHRQKANSSPDTDAET